jgi:HNH endonuclease
MTAGIAHLPARMQAKIQIDAAGCWLWTAGRTQGGYGVSSVGGRTTSAHRITYQLLVGPIPEGMTVDHLCRVRNCVNPAHLEPVPHSENLRRGENRNKSRTHCPQNHPYDGDNLVVITGGRRGCRACRREAEQRYVERKRQAKQAAAISAPA